MSSKEKKPLSIQLAIQGGGAKVVGLIAALEEVQQLEKSGDIRVTRVAATSAGAIAGALFAARVPMSSVKAHMKKFDVEPFRTPTRVAAGLRLWRNQPIFDPKPIRQSLGDLFDDPEIRKMTLREFATRFIPLHITATDVTNSRPYALGPGDSRNLIDAILDSAAVPFLFRMPPTHDAGACMADGGICENLPIDPLRENENVDGPIVAISFAPGTQTPTPPADILGYAAALASAAIDHSVSKAKSRLRWVLELKLDVSSFSFESSLKAGLDKYELLREQTKSFFKDFLENCGKERISTDPWSASRTADNHWEKDLRETMQQIGWMYHTHHLPNVPRIAHSELVVTANSLDRKGGTDAITNTVELHARDLPVLCYRFALTGATDRTDLLHSDVEVRDSGGNIVKCGYLPMVDFGASATARALLVVFQKPLDSNNGPYKVRLTEEVGGFVKGLLDQEVKRDEAYISTKLAQLDAASIVIHCPRSFGQIDSRGEIQRMVDGNLVVATGECGCRKMSESQLANYFRPKGFVSLGWKCDSVPAPAKFSVQLFGS